MSPRDFTSETLIRWGGADVFNQALVAAKKGSVFKADWDDAAHAATGEFCLPTGIVMKTGFTLEADGYVKSHCPCRLNQQGGLICHHVVAIALYLMCRMTDPEAEEKYQAEQRAARRAANVDPGAYIRRSPRGVPMRMNFSWGENFFAEFYGGGVRAHLVFVDAQGVRYRPEDPRLRAGAGIRISDKAENLLSVLEDVCEGPATSEILLAPPDFLNVLAMRNTEAPVKTVLASAYLEERGEFILFPHAELPFEHAANMDRFVVHRSQGFVWSAPLDPARGKPRFFPLANVLPEPFQSVYRGDEYIPREAMGAFIHSNLPTLRRHIEVQMSPSDDLFTFEPDTPHFVLKLSGSRASLGAELLARYGKQELRCGEPADRDVVCRPDPKYFLHYFTRNLPAELAALDELKRLGFAPQDGTGLFVDEPRDVLNVLGRGVPHLRHRGWTVRYSERLWPIVKAMPVISLTVDVKDAPRGAFDVGYVFAIGEDAKAVTQADVQNALNRGDSYVMKDGRTYLFDADAVVSMRKVFEDCSSQGGAAAGHFRVDGVYAPYVRGALNALGDSVEIEDRAAPSWRETAARRSRDENARYEPVDLGPLEGTLRPYQKQGVYWMRFLEKSGLSGLLADEMGLGKTLQTLTWISLRRTAPEAQGKPALVVCPTSLVQNWNAEAETFTPWLKRLVVSGPARAALFGKIPEMDLVITSYALLQRDLEEAYLETVFGIVVLDEAQHIKNRSTRNAQAAKRLQSVQRLVLTGTPVENSVSDVWSIFDFLMPDYLGSYDTFRALTQEPVEQGGPEGQAAQERLRHKLNPFILRRLKKTVANDLPDKIVKVSYCPMTPEQQAWYNRLLQDARARIGDMVKEKGFARSRMEILAVLMRLRQVACHLELLKEFREKDNGRTEGKGLSGKLEVFFEFLDEAIDGGHRILVFSQFVTMLSILRRELSARGIPYCYLDGSTKDRLGECRKFNTNAGIPVFLISLHAGGTGLNLTGADMVVHFDPWWNPAVEAQATDRA
ncbi:MAG: DEAD/DEAH box helicase, partial [Kiritimatiellia bacterium]